MSCQVVRLRRHVASRIDRSVVYDLMAIISELRRGNDGGNELAHTRLAIAAAEQGLSTARLLVQGLRSSEGFKEPTPPVDLGLALKTMLEQVFARDPISFSLQCDSVVELPPATAGEVLHIAREVAINAVKHAAAKTVHCDLRSASDSIVLRIEDDGVGFDAHASTKGFGLIGVTERARAIAARLHIDTSPGEGVAVTLRYPTSTFIPLDPQSDV
jgi:signal transduction histidine kinase